MSQFGIHAWAAGPGEFFVILITWVTVCTWWCARRDV